MMPGEAANPSNGMGPNMINLNNGSRQQLKQNSNEHISAAATLSELQTQPNLLNTASAGGVAAVPHLQPSATAGNAHSSSVVSLPFHSATAAAGIPLGTNPFVTLPQTLAASGEQRLLTPPVFRNTKLRSGKWLREEEAYAELLIELFEKGHVNDCQNGTTLRSYLSQKLHCAPMRISKKYAGRGIGKMVYLCKLSTPGGVGLPFAQQKQIEIMVQSTETKFIKAASPTNEFLRSPTFDLFSGPAHALTTAAPHLVHHGLTSLVPQQQPQPSGLVPTFSQLPLFATAAGHGANALSQQQAQAAFAVAFATAVGAAVDPASTLAQQQAQAALAAATAAPRVLPLGVLTQQHPAPAIATVATGSTTNIAPVQHHGQVVAAQAVAGGSTEHSTPAVAVAQMNPSLSSHTQLHPQAALVSTHGPQGNTAVHQASATIDPRIQLQQAFLNSLMQASMSFPNQLQVPHAAASQNMHEAPTQSVAHSNHQVAPPSGSSCNPGVLRESQAHSVLQSTSHAASIPQQTCHGNEIHDFLSGFDNVALNNTTPNVATAPRIDGMFHGSPPLTSSRSFDEFHRFLGDDLALLDQTTKEASGVAQDDPSKLAARVPGQGSQPPSAVPDTMALFSADSYAMFAQESAMAASQHAAYLNDSGSMAEMKKTTKSPMFDIEGVVKLVSEHVPTQNRQGTTPVVDGNRAKNSPVNALDHLAEFYANHHQQQQQQYTHQHQQQHHRPHHPFLLRLANNQGSAMMMTHGLSSQSEQLLNSPNASAPQVSGSELASATETESSLPGSTSESNASDSNNGSEGNNTGNEDSEDGNQDDSIYSSNEESDASGSYSDEGPSPKKAKLCQWQTRPRNGARTNNEET